MSSNYINANNINVEERPQVSMVKLKIRINLIFRTLHTSQQTVRDKFRRGERAIEEDNGDSLAQELSGSEIRFVDTDEDSGEYLLKDKTYVVAEASPKAMELLSRSIDTYVKGFCDLSDVEKVSLCFFVPSISDSPIIPTLFFQSFPPACVLSDGQKGTFRKIDNGRSNLVYFGIGNIIRFNRGKNSKSNFANETLNRKIVQIAALICHYTYFYIDYYELNDWSFFKDTKDSVANRDSIKKFFSKPTKTKVDSIWNKIGQSIAVSLSIPRVVLQKAFDILCNYDWHLKGRIYHRIEEISNITGQDTCETIMGILTASAQRRTPVSLYEYFEIGGYWKYLKSEDLEEEAKKWKIISHKKGKVSGFGALLFTNGKDYICCFKGTDFDSYGRDWIFTNLLQGLTGFSLQHVLSVIEGKKLDTEVAQTGNVWFVGHSLGGGLASAATIATKGRTGITFNAAGLNFMGVKLNQLINNFSSIIHPSQCWNRVFPYRIKGEVLDQAQKIYLRPIALGTLERGYGKKSVEIELRPDGKEIPCFNRHGINNFLYKDVMNALQPFNEQPDQEVRLTNWGNNKVRKIEFFAKESKMETEF